MNFKLLSSIKNQQRTLHSIIMSSFIIVVLISPQSASADTQLIANWGATTEWISPSGTYGSGACGSGNWDLSDISHMEVYAMNHYYDNCGIHILFDTKEDWDIHYFYGGEDLKITIRFTLDGQYEDHHSSYLRIAGGMYSYYQSITGLQLPILWNTGSDNWYGEYLYLSFDYTIPSAGYYRFLYSFSTYHPKESILTPRMHTDFSASDWFSLDWIKIYEYVLPSGGGCNPIC